MVTPTYRWETEALPKLACLGGRVWARFCHCGSQGPLRIMWRGWGAGWEWEGGEGGGPRHQEAQLSISPTRQGRC